MHIEIWKNDRKTGPLPKQKWFWHFKNKGRIVSDAEPFPSKGNAIRAAKAVVKGVVGELVVYGIDFMEPEFSKPRWDEKRKAFIITWQ